MTPQQRNDLGLALSVAVLVALLAGGGEVLPLTPVDSPFPSEGLWLLVASESGNLSGAEAAANAESVRNFPGLNRRVLDFDQKPTEEPWQTALAWAKERSGGSPYYVMRHGRRAKEGTLDGSLDEMLQTLNAALGEL